MVSAPRVWFRAIILGALVSAAAHDAAAEACPGQWAILHGSASLGGAATQPLPAQTVDYTWVMRQTAGSGPYGTWRLVHQVTEFTFLHPLPAVAVPPSVVSNIRIGDRAYPCQEIYSTTSARHECATGIDYQVTPQGIFAPGNIPAGAVHNGELRIDATPGATDLVPASGVGLTMIGRPGPLTSLVTLIPTAQRNSALAPSPYRVFVTVHVDPVGLMSNIALDHRLAGVSSVTEQVSADGLSKIFVINFPGINALPDPMLDQPINFNLILDDCRITATTTLRNIL